MMPSTEPAVAAAKSNHHHHTTSQNLDLGTKDIIHHRYLIRIFLRLMQSYFQTVGLVNRPKQCLKQRRNFCRLVDFTMTLDRLFKIAFILRMGLREFHVLTFVVLYSLSRDAHISCYSHHLIISIFTQFVQRTNKTRNSFPMASCGCRTQTSGAWSRRRHRNTN